MIVLDGTKRIVGLELRSTIGVRWAGTIASRQQIVIVTSFPQDGAVDGRALCF